MAANVEKANHSRVNGHVLHKLSRRGDDLLVLLYLLAGIWLLTSAAFLNRDYQDSWVLEGLFLPLLVLLITYCIATCKTNNLERVALLAAGNAFLLHSFPALKYTTTYLSTIDSATHTSTIRTMVATGQVDPTSTYANTPGFHALVALLAEFSNLPFELWAKLFPAFLGSMIPLALYYFCRRARLPRELAKIALIVSPFSLPILYTLNGTSFAAPIFASIAAILFAREVSEADTGTKISQTLLLLLLIAQMIFWHPGTSLLMPLFFLAFGSLRLVPRSKAPFLAGEITCSHGVFRIGVLAITGVLAYWMFDAEFIFKALVKNISSAVRAESPDLLPATLWEISLTEQAIVGLLYHARDGAILTLALYGFFAVFADRSSSRYVSVLRVLSLLWVLSVLLLLFLFLVDFGSQGYKRFILYPIVLSPLPAAYTIWKTVSYSRVASHSWRRRSVAVAYVIALAVAGVIQLYPYQPLVPSHEAAGNKGTPDPLVWIHQVNTSYQYYMLRFAHQALPSDAQVVTDYIGYQQSKLFFDSEVRRPLRQVGYQEPASAFLALHLPGKAGAYGEQAEYRSARAIESWRGNPRASLVYDNGGSFILYYPDNARAPFWLGRSK